MIYEDGRPHRNETRYLDIGGQEIAVLNSSFTTHPYVPNYSFQDRRFGRQDGTFVDGAWVKIYGRSDQEALVQQDMVRLEEDMVTGQGLHIYLRDHLEQLAAGNAVKQVRFLVILKLLAYTIRHFVRPKSIERIKLDDEVLPAAVISSILAIVMLWCLTVAVGAVALSFDPKLDLVSALTSSATMVGNCGPALSFVEPAAAQQALLHGGAAITPSWVTNVGPFGGFGGLADGSKVLMSLQMLFGRLELLTALVLFSPSFWRR